jgi:hypothetical protein
MTSAPGAACTGDYSPRSCFLKPFLAQHDPCFATFFLELRFRRTDDVEEPQQEPSER